MKNHHCTRYKVAFGRSLWQQPDHKWERLVVVQIAQENQCILEKEWCNTCLTCKMDQQARLDLPATKQN